MIEWIVSASVLTAVIIALRYILKGKISLRLQYALWGLVLLRLLIPFHMGSSGISVMNTVEQAPIVQEARSVSGVETIERREDGSVQGFTRSDHAHDSPTLIAQHKTEQEFTRMKAVLDLRAVLKPIWLGGTAVLLLVFAAANLRFAYRLRRTRRPLKVQGSALPVYVTDAAAAPCLFGLFSPAIYLPPAAAADATVLRHTVEHETTHRRHGDNFWALLRGLCLALHWFNPLVWWAAVLSRNDAELACDEATIRRIGEGERAEYGRTLIAMTCQKRPALLTAATTMTGGKSSLQERITLIARKPKMAVYTLVAVVLIAAVTVGCTFTGAKSDSTTALPDAPDTSAVPQPDQELPQLILDYYQQLYQPRRVFLQGEEPDPPQEGDFRIENIRLLGEAPLYEAVGEAYEISRSSYDLRAGTWDWTAWQPDILIMTRSQDGTVNSVLGSPGFNTDGMETEDVIRQTVWGLLDLEVALWRDGYPAPVGPGGPLTSSCLGGGQMTTEVLEGWEPSYSEESYWFRGAGGTSSGQFTADCYYDADQARESINTLDVTMTDLYTPRGVRVGDSREAVTEAYPQLNRRDYWGLYPGEDFMWYCGDPNDLGPALLFFFEGDRVSRIVLTNMFD